VCVTVEVWVGGIVSVGVALTCGGDAVGNTSVGLGAAIRASVGVSVPGAAATTPYSETRIGMALESESEAG
jgi:hypothetical protein